MVWSCRFSNGRHGMLDHIRDLGGTRADDLSEPSQWPNVATCLLQEQ
jgi:hypothetical protein